MAKKTTTAEDTGRFAYGGLERVIHERARLSILASLASHDGGLLFTELKSLCRLTDGNLSRQLTTLAEAKLVETWKGTRNNRPQTLVKLTATGRKRFAEYIAELEAVVSDAKQMAAPSLARPATA
jgi:DNA-binding MarR family transcriptional regulator